MDKNNKQLEQVANEVIHPNIHKEYGRGASTNKQLDVVEKILLRGKRNFGSSGASLTHQISNPEYKDAGIDAGLAKVGLAGEHKTSKQLREWIKDKPNVVLVDSVHIKGHGKEELNEETGTIDGGDTDHLLIVGNVVILIDSKNWKKKRKYGVNEKGVVTRSGKPFPGSNVRITQAMYLWKKYLDPHRVTTRAVINITSEEVFVVRDVNWWKQSFKVVAMPDLFEILDKIWERIPDEQKNVIDVNIVSDVVISAIKPYDVVKESLGSAAYLLRD